MLLKLAPEGTPGRYQGQEDGRRHRLEHRPFSPAESQPQVGPGR